MPDRPAGSITGFLRARAVDAKPPLYRAVGLSLAGGLVVIAQAYVAASIVAAVIIDKQGVAGLWRELAVLPALYLLRALFTYLSERASFEAAALVRTRLRAELMAHIGRLGPVRLAATSAGDLATMLADGVEAVEAYYARFLPAMALTVLLPAAILVVVLPQDWLSALVMLVTAPLIPFFMMLIGKGTEKLNQRQWRKLARLSKHFLDVIQGLPTLKLFGAAKREAAAIDRVSEDYRRSTMEVLRVAFLSSLVLEFFATVSIAIIAVLIGFRLLYGEMSFFDGFFVLLLAPDFYLPLRQMGTHYHARMAAIGAAERMLEVLEMQPALPAEIASVPFRPASHEIRFDEVSFAYEHGRPALDRASFHIPQGARVALVGPSGAGKSTVLGLLLGFIQPDEGRILVGGAALGPAHMQDWRDAIAYVPQAPTLFKGSILDNLRLGRSDASIDEVRAAVKAAEALDFIEALPQGFDSEVGEKGLGLSGGQIQRLAIARALLRDAPVVLLDEPTANLDLASEALVQQALERLATGRTTLTIAHRLSTAKSADRILVLDKGRIAEQGRHDDLVARGGLYARLAASYAGSGEE